MADLRTAMADVIQCHDVHTREAQEAMADAILALPEMQAMLAEVERLRAVLATIDNAHEPQVDTDLDSLTMGGLFCTEDDEPWPCRTHLLLHPEEARRA